MSGRVENLRPAHPEEFELYEYATEGATELNAHVTEHLLTRCAACTKLLDDIRVLDRARTAREEWDKFFEDMPSDDAPPAEQTKAGSMRTSCWRQRRKRTGWKRRAR